MAVVFCGSRLQNCCTGPRRRRLAFDGLRWDRAFQPWGSIVGNSHLFFGGVAIVARSASFMVNPGRFGIRPQLERLSCFLPSLVGPIDRALRAHQFGPSFISIRPILADIGVEEERAASFCVIIS